MSKLLTLVAKGLPDNKYKVYIPDEAVEPLIEGLQSAREFATVDCDDYGKNNFSINLGVLDCICIECPLGSNGKESKVELRFVDGDFIIFHTRDDIHSSDFVTSDRYVSFKTRNGFVFVNPKRVILSHIS